VGYSPASSMFTTNRKRVMDAPEFYQSLGLALPSLPSGRDSDKVLE